MKLILIIYTKNFCCNWVFHGKCFKWDEKMSIWFLKYIYYVSEDFEQKNSPGFIFWFPWKKEKIILHESPRSGAMLWLWGHPVPVAPPLSPCRAVGTRPLMSVGMQWHQLWGDWDNPPSQYYSRRQRRYSGFQWRYSGLLILIFRHTVFRHTVLSVVRRLRWTSIWILFETLLEMSFLWDKKANSFDQKQTCKSSVSVAAFL